MEAKLDSCHAQFAIVEVLRGQKISQSSKEWQMMLEVEWCKSGASCPSSNLWEKNNYKEFSPLDSVGLTKDSSKITAPT